MSKITLGNQELTAEEASQFVKLNAAREGVAGFVQQVVTAGERRNAELVEQGRALWEAVAKKYDLDLQHVAYEYQDGKLVPVQVRA